ncbi:hypothetical protein ACHFJ0_09000 [Paracoccus sp. NGMCC 1.201697]|uniref:Uncharacterized protein n=1 Tax=Paracoccus broussonetiae subsp. drimophilus TaxID=3373869 RepID=A0ABW7LJ77_9RHOB
MEDEIFAYPRNNPGDVSRYGFLKDISRLKDYVSAGPLRSGSAIILTNEPRMWKPARAGASDEAFSLTEGRSIGNGLLGWSDATSTITRAKHPGIEIRGKYDLLWSQYSLLAGSSCEFRTLALAVEP